MRVFIDGESGTTGLGISARLAVAEGYEILSLVPSERKNPRARQEMMAKADIAVLCLPDDAAVEAVALAEELGPSAPRILDASTAHRTKPGWVYGFAEMTKGQDARIASARRVANPGCYATGAIALLRPLIDAGVMPRNFPISINAVSGYSGGGRTMIGAHEKFGGPGFELYALSLEHKHIPEIVAQTGLESRPIFVPSVGHFRQGMLVSIPLFLEELATRPTATDLHEVLRRHYAVGGQVRVVSDAAVRLEAEALNGTDALELFVFSNTRWRQAVLVARLDNLGKGASGAAVQNLALMRRTIAQKGMVAANV